MRKVYLSLFIVMVVLSCSNITNDKAHLLVDKQFGDGCKMIVEMVQSDTLKKLHVSIQLSNITYSSVPSGIQGNKMLYGIDSAFYLQCNGLKVYPDAVEPVMIGIDRRFDYLIYYKSPMYLDHLKLVFCFKDPLDPLSEHTIDLIDN